MAQCVNVSKRKLIKIGIVGQVSGFFGIVHLDSCIQFFLECHPTSLGDGHVCEVFYIVFSHYHDISIIVYSMSNNNNNINNNDHNHSNNNNTRNNSNKNNITSVFT